MEYILALGESIHVPEIFLYFNPFDDNWKLVYCKKETLNICYFSQASGPTSKGCDVTHNF